MKDNEVWLVLYQGLLAAHKDDDDPSFIADWAARAADHALVEYKERLSGEEESDES